MNSKRIMTIIILVLGLLLSLSVGLSAAREAQDDSQPVNPESANAAVSHRIPVQGRLTNASGSMLIGDYNLTFRVYNQLNGGFLLCQDTHLVHVDNGLFNTTIEGCSTADIDGKQPFLGIEVENDGEMTPRLPLYPVPFAYSLVQGAILRGSFVGKPMFTVANSASDGIALMADGRFQSTASTYLFIPGSAIVRYETSDETDIQILSGAARIHKGFPSAGSQTVILPITIPSVMYGQRVRIKEIRIFYVCEYASSYIDYTSLHRQTGATTANLLINNGTNRTSTSPTSYAPPIDLLNDTLSADSGPLTLQLLLRFENNASYIQIGMVRLTLEHD